VKTARLWSSLGKLVAYHRCASRVDLSCYRTGSDSSQRYAPASYFWLHPAGAKTGRVVSIVQRVSAMSSCEVPLCVGHPTPIHWAYTPVCIPYDVSIGSAVCLQMYPLHQTYRQAHAHTHTHTQRERERDRERTGTLRSAIARIYALRAGDAD